MVELDKVADRYNGVTDEILHDESLAWLYVLAKGYREIEEVDAVMDRFPGIEEFAKMHGIALDDPTIKGD